MPIQVRCEHCQAKMKLADKFQGKKIRCPKCKGVIRVEGEVVPSQPKTSPKETPKKTPEPAAAPAASPSADLDTEDWYMQTEDGETYGPVPREELDEWHEEGRISAECQLLKDGTDQWVWASDVYADLEEESGEAPTDDEESPFGFSDSSSPETKPVASASSTPAPATSSGEVGTKSKIVAGLLAIFLGLFGAHRFYLGYTGMGIAQLLTCGGCGWWSLIEGIMIFTGSFKEDASGKLLKD